MLERIDAAAATTGKTITAVTADAGYAYCKVYGGLERRGIDPIKPVMRVLAVRAVCCELVSVPWVRC